MDRMAQHTRQPEVLRELFDALGNDPFVIAECLARPALGERFLSNSFANQVKQFSQSQIAAATASYRLPIISDTAVECTDDTWTATSTVDAPLARIEYTAIWTGSEMIVWGGVDVSINYLNSGGSYNPATDSWTSTSTYQCAHSPNRSHGSVDWRRNDSLGWTRRHARKYRRQVQSRYKQLDIDEHHQRTSGSGFPDRSMDRERNDHLGWHRLSKHRR